jgi:hypothetical protein
MPPGGVGINPGPSDGPAGPPMDDLHDDEGGPDKGMKVIFEGELRPSGDGDAPDPLPEAAPDTLPGDDLPPRSTHITTPNGLRGTILGKTKSLWGEQVTIRLENGRIAKFDVTENSGITFEAATQESSNPYHDLQRGLDADVDPTERGLRVRIAQLKSIKDEAKATFRTASYVDETSLHNIIVEADAQLSEVMDALEHMQQAEPFAPPEPQVFEQESMGGVDSSWLDSTFEQMANEAEATDFDQEMAEAPELLTAELETPALHDQVGVRDHALAYVNTKVAGLDSKTVHAFRNAFLARVETCRVAEIATRTEEVERVAKTASTDDYDGPAEGLFF